MTTPHEYAANNYDTFVQQLIDLIRIPSVSTQPKHKDDVRRAAEWVKEHCLSLGMTHAEILETELHPVVYAEWLEAGEDKPTVLVYGHYDVQPPEPLDLWEQDDPFEPVIRDDKLYARGATDDKGQMFIHLKVFESFMQTHGEFPVNVKFLIEGEEEIGSRNLAAFIEKYADKLTCNVVALSDTGLGSVENPILVYGLRGMCYTELEVTGPIRDLHSGAYGGIVHNPAQVIAEIIASMHDETGFITVDGFYDKVLPLSAEERQMLAPAAELFAASLEENPVTSQLWGEPDFNPLERIGARPTLEVNGLYSGYTERGGQKTVLPAWALAKISCRLVPDQDPFEIFDLLKAHIEKVAPSTITWELRMLGKSKASVVDVQSPQMQVAVDAYEQVFGVRPSFVRGGGTIPVVGLLGNKLNVPVVMLGFGLPDDNLHSPNEKFSLEMFRKGIETSIIFYEGLSELSM